MFNLAIALGYDWVGCFGIDLLFTLNVNKFNQYLRFILVVWQSSFANKRALTQKYLQFNYKQLIWTGFELST